MSPRSAHCAQCSYHQTVIGFVAPTCPRCKAQMAFVEPVAERVMPSIPMGGSLSVRVICNVCNAVGEVVTNHDGPYRCPSPYNGIDIMRLHPVDPARPWNKLPTAVPYWQGQSNPWTVVRRRRTQRTRDAQRSKLYAAESTWRWVSEVASVVWPTRTDSLATLQHSVDEITAWLGIDRVTVRFKAANASGHWAHARYTDRSILLPSGSSGHRMRGMDVLTHEVVHHYLHGIDPSYQAHGAEFCRAYLMVVHRFLGDDAANALRVAMLGKGCKVAPLAWWSRRRDAEMAACRVEP